MNPLKGIYRMCVCDSHAYSQRTAPLKLKILSGHARTNINGIFLLPYSPKKITIERFLCEEITKHFNHARDEMQFKRVFHR